MADFRTMPGTYLGTRKDIELLGELLVIKDRFLIDAGCGDMALARSLADLGARVLAVDPDPVQAERNRQATITANVGFAETGADALPVEPDTVDGVIFRYSLHHVPADIYSAVFDEAVRVLKPDGFICVIEPVADGPLNSVQRLFHDEEAVRAAAQQALTTLAIPRFAKVFQYRYVNAVEYRSWDEFRDHYTKASYNTSSYSQQDVEAPEVKAAFDMVSADHGPVFESPVHVTLMQNPVKLAA